MEETETDDEFIRSFGYANLVEVFVHGDSSRTKLARRVVENFAALKARAIHLLDSFMRDRGEFDLNEIQVLEGKSPGGSDFLFRFTFTADRDPNEYGYTYFKVYFFSHEPPSELFSPHKFEIGFY